MQSSASHKALAIQHSDTKIVELSGYVVIVVQSLDGKVKLFGSPADKDNLEVADEVLNVNERVLCDLPHAEVVRYLHELNQSKGPNSLSSSAQQPDFSFLREGSPIYVTSLSGQNVTGSCTKTTDSSVAFKPAPITQPSSAAAASYQPPAAQQFINSSSTPKSAHATTNAPTAAAATISAATATPAAAAAANNHKPLSAAGSQLSSSSAGSAASKTVTLNNNNNNNNNHLGGNGSGAHPQTSFDSFFGNSAKSTPVTASEQQQQHPAQVNGHHPTSTTTTPAAANATATTQATQLTTLSEVDSDPATGADEYQLLQQQQQADLYRAAAAAQAPITTGGSEVLLGDQSLRQDYRPRRRSGSQIAVVGDDTTKAHLSYDEGEFISGPLNYSPVQQQQLYAASAGNMDVLTANSQDNGPYQEMAVDVPDSFIARNKTPPRYPPPQHQLQHHHQPPMHSQVNAAAPIAIPSAVVASAGGGMGIGATANGAGARAQPQVASSAVVKSPMSSFFHSLQSQSPPSDRDISLELQPLHTFGKSAQKHHNHHHHNYHHHHHHHTNTTTLHPSPTSATTVHKSSQRSKAPSSSNGSLCESIGFDSMSYRTKSKKGSSISSHSSSSDLGPPEYDSSMHRELPVDVPENFVELKKGPPRYPPPPRAVVVVPPPVVPPQLPVKGVDSMVVPQNMRRVPAVANIQTLLQANGTERGSPVGERKTNDRVEMAQDDQTRIAEATDEVAKNEDFEVVLLENGAALRRNNELNSSVRPVPPPRDHLRIEQDGRLVNRAPAPQVPERNHPQHLDPTGTVANSPIAQVMAPTSEQLDTIQKYKDQLRRRHEDNNRVAQENDFMRASLRESRKLQSLQSHRPPAGVENTGYVDDDVSAHTAAASEEHPATVVGPTFDDVQSAIVQIHYELNKCGLTGPANRIAMVQQLLAAHDFAHALALREQVLQRRRTRHHNPVSLNTQELAKECVDALAESSSPLAIELCDILASYEMEGLMLTHDAIANDTDSTPDPNPQRRHVSDAARLQQPPALPAHPSHPLAQNHVAANNNHHINNNGSAVAVHNSNNAKLPAVYHSGDATIPIRIIQIEKSSEPLGATILNEGDAVVIGRIVRGGAAEKSGLLHEHDEILEVNGIEMAGRNVNDVCALLGAMSGTLTFLVVPAAGRSAAAAAAAAAATSTPNAVAATLPGAGGREPSVLHVRAHFDYDPEDDRYIPCRELGISFQKGDVLHVISRDDSNWWQAYREGEEDQTLAGLIPSQSFQHQREAMRLAAAGEAGLMLGGRGKGGTLLGGGGGGGGSKTSTLLCMRKAGKGKKKRLKTSSEAGYPLYATTTPDDPDPEEILTYEEVALYYPRESHKRPIVLIGPPNIGRHELRQRLIADSDRFAAAVPHTSRPPRRDQEEDYHFISRVQFEADIRSKKFVEHGEYDRAYYGTSFEAIRTVASSGRNCVINLHPQSLKLLRDTDLKPYVVLVAPPSLEKLRQKKERNSEPLKDDDLKEIIATARDMEARWGHLFDNIIINNDTERAYHQLLAEINSLEREPQWVPASWVH